MYWRPAITVLHLHLSPVLKQQLRHRYVAVSRSYMELGDMFNTDCLSIVKYNVQRQIYIRDLDQTTFSTTVNVPWDYKNYY